MKSMSTKGKRLILDIDVSLRYPCSVVKEAEKIALRVRDSIEEHTSINVKAVNINVRTLHLSREIEGKLIKRD